VACEHLESDAALTEVVNDVDEVAQVVPQSVELPSSKACTRNGRRARLVRAVQRVYEWCRKNRHLPVRQQHEALRRRMQGHINYFGVNGNIPSLKRFVNQVTRGWFKWLNRRSQRARLTWERFEDLLEDLPLPKARIVVSIWR
jgi:RNA-directed DNA polymerase